MSGTYKSPAAKFPTIAEFSKISEDLNLKCSDEEVKAIVGHFKGVAKSLLRINELTEPSLPVKYPRTPGYRPSADDNPYNAWYWRCDIQSGKGGKLSGKTLGIKDTIPVAGVPMMNGSKVQEGYTPEYDATVITRVLDAGGHIIGKAACEDLCFSGSSFTCSAGPIRNPHDETMSAGGSSSGCAALLAGGKIDMGIGGDQGGSIRIPSSFSGIVGMKPTFGLVPYTGAACMERTLDHLGPMARNVTDCALLLEVIAGLDGDLDDRQPRDLKVPEYSKLLDAGIAGKKIGLLTEGFTLCKEDDVAALVRKSANKLTQAGATVEEVSVPEHLDGETIWKIICIQGAYDCMVKDSCVGSQHKGFYPTSLHESYNRGVATRPYDLSVTMKLIVITAEYLNKMYGKKFYAKAKNLNLLLNKAYNKALETYDVLILPTLPYKASKIPAEGSTTEELFSSALSMLTNTAPFDNTGHPAISINAGFSDKLPVGMMIVGRHFEDATVLQVARAYEKL